MSHKIQNKSKDMFIKIKDGTVFLYNEESPDWLYSFPLEDKEYNIDLLGDAYDFDYNELRLIFMGK